MTDWHNVKPGLLKKKTFYLPECDTRFVS